MYGDYKVIAVTPAGRRRYLEILLRYTRRFRHILDGHVLWVNTTKKDDLDYMERVARKYPDFISLLKPNWPVAKRAGDSIYQFFPHAIDPQTIYIRLDDDICYIGPGSIDALVQYRIANREPFLVYPVKINNGMEWVLKPFEPVAKWKRGIGSALEHVRRHVEFLSDPTPERYFCEPYRIEYNRNIAVNCICWFGRDFAEFGGRVPPPPIDEERWLSMQMPKALNRPNYITGNSLMVHFSFGFSGTMRFLEEHTDLYSRYLELSLDGYRVSAL